MASADKTPDTKDKKRETFKEELVLNYVFEHATEGDVTSVINTIDKFCSEKDGWMMNVGDVKGQLLDAELSKKKPKHAVELGGYCGYSALRIARKLAENNNGGHLTSVEISPLHAAIATKILEFAGQRDRVTVVVGTVPTKIEKLKALGTIDLLFIDHLKSAYKPDLIALEQAGLIKPGSVLVADNCLYPGCPDYVEYIREHPQYDSVRHETTLEYCNEPDHVWVSTRK